MMRKPQDLTVRVSGFICQASSGQSRAATRHDRYSRHSRYPPNRGAIISYVCIMQTDLETEIQSAWTRAHTLLSRENADADEIAVIVGELRNCAEQVREEN